MAKKKIAFIKSFAKFLLLTLTSAAAIALLFSYLAKLIPPSVSHLVAYCGLLFPYFLFANVGFAVIWLFIDYRWSLLPTVIILMNINNIDRHFQMRAQEKPEICANCLKVMSYNVRMFNKFVEDRDESNITIVDFLKKERPDILCVQEYLYDASGKTHHYNTTQHVLQALGLPDNNKTYRTYLLPSGISGYQSGLAIFSRYRIIDCGIVEMPDSSANKTMYVDIRYNSDTLRIYNLHLSSMKLDDEDYATGKAILHNHADTTPNIDYKVRKLNNKIASAFESRQYQARNVHRSVDSCRYPVIVCGDFNDSPASYSYNKIARRLKDSFRSSGKGTGTTYAGEVFPTYRIDYILHDRRYNDFGYTVCREMDASDHYPIYTYISIINKK